MRASFLPAVSLLALILTAAPGDAAVPPTISYQGLLKDQSGVIVPDGDYVMTFRIYAAAGGGTPLWWESQTLAVRSGVFNAILGSVTPLGLSFSDPCWLSVAIGGDPELAPRLPFASSPYSFHAAVSDSATGAVGEVVAGEGLTGGGGSGQVTLALGNGGVTSPKIADDAVEFRHLGPNQAAQGQVIKWNGTAWVASDDYGVAGPIVAITTDPSLCCGGDHGEIHLTIAPGGVQSSMIENGAVTGDKIAAGAVAGGALAAAAVTSDKIADFSVASTDLAAAAVTRSKLADAAVDAAKLESDAVTGIKIADGAVGTADLGSGAVMSSTIADGSVATSDLADGAVTSAKIADGTIATADLADGAVTSGKIVDGTIATADLAASSVNGDKIADSSVASADLAAGAVTNTKLVDAAVNTAKLDVDAVTSGKIAAGAVGNGDLGDSAVTTEKIQDGTIAFADIGQNGASTGQVMKWDGTAWVAAADNTGGGGGGGGWVDDGAIVRLETSSDRVGIGTDAPTVPLDVAGDARFTGKVTIGPGHHNEGDYALVAGEENWATGDHSTVTGGKSNRATGDYCVVGGGGGDGLDNEARGSHATIGGGGANVANGRYAVIFGGGGNADSSNTAEGHHSVIGGGGGNRAGTPRPGGGPSDDLAFTTVGGGFGNEAARAGATVAGGIGNHAAPLQLEDPNQGMYATVGGGAYNQAAGRWSFVGGGGGSSPSIGNLAAGEYSVVAGGRANVAGARTPPDGQTGRLSAIGGGSENTATGAYATVPGGFLNRSAGDYSFSAGQQAKAWHHGSIVLAANPSNTVPDSVYTGCDGQMVLRANGGIYVTNTGGMAPSSPNRLINTSTGAYLSTAGQWVNSSDRNAKTDFTEVDRGGLLDRLDALPITAWRFRSEEPRVRHIGPVAQDFHAAFGLGDDDRAIGTLDVGGVSLAAIQELHRAARVREARLQELEARVAELEARVRVLAAENGVARD